jgi:hypothetical protein
MESSEVSSIWGFEESAVAAPPPPGVRAEPVQVPVKRTMAQVPAKPSKPHAFDAELELSEIDDRGRPGTAWTARGREVSRERLVLRSRRMVRLGCMVIVAVHLLDDAPMPLFGKVVSCDYDADGLHKVTVEFRPVPWSGELRTWMMERVRK